MVKTRGCLSKLLLLIIVIGVAAAAAPLVPLSPLKNQVERKLSETLGRRVTIDSVRLNLIRGPYLAITGMTAAEDPQFGDGVFIKANDVRAGLDVSSYMRTRQIVIDSITLKSPQIDLVKNKNGVWNWTTLGRKASPQSTASLLFQAAVSPLPILSIVWQGTVSAATFRKINIESASVRLVDHTEPQSSSVLYKNIDLNAWLAPYSDEKAGAGSEAKGDLVVRSEEDGEADRFRATMPFDLKIVGSVSAVSVSGSLGPGLIETKNVSVGTLAVSGQVNANKDAPLTGSGQFSATDLVLTTVNLSERVARALKLDQIGDMSPGTSVARLETDFNIARGVVNTTSLNIEQLDGLGDATVPTGSFKIEAALTLNYAAMVILSPEATLRVKSVSPTLGLFVTILETNNRLSIPINISGDVRTPDVQVDVSRIF